MTWHTIGPATRISTNKWTLHDDETLRFWWGKKSAAQIAEILSPKRTKNAVIARANRLHLKQMKGTIGRDGVLHLWEVITPLNEGRSPSVEPQHSYFGLRSRCCIVMCGKTRQPGKKFCAEHHRRAILERKEVNG